MSKKVEKKSLSIIYYVLCLIVIFIMLSCNKNNNEDIATIEETEIVVEEIKETEEQQIVINSEKVYLDMEIPYATYSVINDGYATLYTHDTPSTYTVAINAGHGTVNGSKFKTYSHPDFSPKVSGGTNAEGEVLSSAISEGTVLLNGMKEADVNLLVAMKAKEKLLLSGYDVLMIREDDNSRLDNIARTVLANKYADCHIAIHFDSTETDKGIFYIAPKNDEIYLSIEPLKSNYHNIKKFGECMINAFRECGLKIWKDKGILQGDLTQLSYSTNASIDLELGDKATVITEESIDIFADGIVAGVNKYFNE